ncbi:hypothetical protein E8E13_009445 [Curvularia kusanoi]|uniref:Oxidase cueO n=1 Tax=Curvularia kusanoi TaxID=90978 RepID=A0A9P4W763_CURKU|nr:hypothetical protein E8E13_009445 [Curvularia kusanoi]
MPGQILQTGLAALLWAGGAFAQGGGFPWLSPVYPLFTQPLVQGANIAPKASLGNIDYYEIDIKPVDVQIYPNLKPTRLVGYNGQVPGPTFRMRQGREAIVRFINHGDLANSVHLHGSYSRAPFDGWADDTTEPGQFKDYYYPNRQNARTLWYHDHAIDHTAKNAYYGQAGFYILSDAQEDSLFLPDEEYDLPLALAAKRYNSDGSLWDPEANGETVSVFGDVIHVNGVPWPFKEVEPRKYRLRFLNTGISRSYQLYFEASGSVGKQIPFTVFASDTGTLLNPVQTNDLYISDAERWEVIFDFSGYAGQNVTLRNSRKVAADDDYAATDQVLQFRVGNKVSRTDHNLDNTSDKSPALPSTLRQVDFPPAHAPTEYNFRFERQNGKWEVNGVTWSDVNQRVLAKPERGAVQKWTLTNTGGGWSHPIHIHLVDLQITARRGGRGALMPYEKVALKDVMWLNVNEEIDVVARYAPWDGLYMFHCHNLIHEDHEMLAAFNVTALPDLNYPETTHFIDPMEPRYRAAPFADTDYTARTGNFSTSEINRKIQWFADLKAYEDVDGVEAALKSYWATHTPGATGSAAPVKSTAVVATSTPTAVKTTTPAATTPAPTTLATVTSNKNQNQNQNGKKTTTA